jgi:hypothetical protein
MVDPADFDAPRHPVADLDADDVAQLRKPQGTTDLDEVAIADSRVELVDEELTVTVVPMLADEFRCASCYLVHHRSRLVHRADGSDVCTDCS